MDAKQNPSSRLLRKGRYSQQGRCYLITTVTDQRAPIFSDFYSARCLINVLMRLHQEQQFEVKAFVLMPDHLHCLLVLPESKTLSDGVRVLKGRSSRLINTHQKKSGKFWQQGFHDHALRDGENLDEYIDYLLANPLRKNLVDNISQYSHWDVLSDSYFDRG